MKQLKTCPKGHQYYKSTDCPSCPVCEAAKKPGSGLLSLVGAPARRALENNNISTLKQLAEWSEAELLALHGLGPATMPALKKALSEAGLAFKK